MIPLQTSLKRALLNADNGPVLSPLTVSTVSTAAAATFTAAQVLGGHINRDPAGASRSDVLPTAALLVGALREYANQLGVQLAPCSFEFVIQNTADAAETITLGPGSGGSTASGHTMTIAQNNSKRFSIQITNVTRGSEAYVVRNRGNFTT